MSQVEPQSGSLCALATIAEAATFLNVSRSLVYELIQSGELPVIKLRRCTRIKLEDLRALADRGTPE
ncbi:MAG: helix-turn-helix domain-containing protein [Planctomycetaceae bacterium]|nr:helix-turn-helix domain-containing protein [Planctomycetaceae bacterium]